MGLIILENLTKFYNNKKSKICVLKDVSYSFNNCGLYIIKGTSGVGKSTLLNLISGDVTGYSGNIIFNGIDLKKYKSKDSYRNSFISSIYQEKNLIDHLSIYENIKIVLDLQNKKNDGIIEDVAKKLGIYELLSFYPIELSGGERQKASIARALVKGSSIILADEITSNLDNNSKIEIMEIIKDISKEKLVIMVCHDNELIDEYADCILKIDNCNLISVAYKIEGIKDFRQSRLIKSYFDYKNIIKGSINIIKIKPIRLFISLLVMILVGSAYGVLFNLYTINSKKIHLVHYDSGKYYDLIVGYGYTDDDGNSINYEMDRTVLELFENTVPNVKYNKIYGHQREEFNHYIYNTLGNQFYYHDYFSGLMEINENIASQNGFKLLAGNYPINNDEVVITEYCYEIFKAGNYKDTNYNKIDINIYDDILGKQIVVFDQNFIISGIISTGTILNDFSFLKNKDNTYYDYFNQFMWNGIDTILFTRHEFIENSDIDLNLNRLYIGNNNLSREIFLNSLDLKNYNKYFRIEGMVYNEIETRINNIRQYTPTILLILSVVTIFLIALILNYFNYTFTLNHKFIGIYRSLGAKKVHIISLYMIISAFIFITTVIASYPIIKFFITKYNDMMVGEIFFLLDIFIYDINSLMICSIIFLIFATVPFVIASSIKLSKDSYYILNMRD